MIGTIDKVFGFFIMVILFYCGHWAGLFLANLSISISPFHQGLIEKFIGGLVPWWMAGFLGGAASVSIGPKETYAMIMGWIIAVSFGVFLTIGEVIRYIDSDLSVIGWVWQITANIIYIIAAILGVWVTSKYRKSNNYS